MHAYLNRYAAVGGLPAAEMSTANTLYQHLQQLRTQVQAAEQAQHLASSNPHVSEQATEEEPQVTEAAGTTQLVDAQLAFLAAAVDLARRRFTLFQQGPIWAGCALGVGMLVLQLAYCW